MDGNVAVALIGGITSIMASVITVISVIVTSNKNNAAVDAKLDKQQAVIETKLETLTVEVQKHNSFASRVPLLEQKVGMIEDQITELKRRGTA